MKFDDIVHFTGELQPGAIVRNLSPRDWPPATGLLFGFLSYYYYYRPADRVGLAHIRNGNTFHLTGVHAREIRRSLHAFVNLDVTIEHGRNALSRTSCSSTLRDIKRARWISRFNFRGRYSFAGRTLFGSTWRDLSMQLWKIVNRCFPEFLVKLLSVYYLYLSISFYRSM